MLAVGNIVQITDVQVLFGEEVLNTYYYRVLSLDAGAEYADLANAFQGSVVQDAAAFQHSALSHTRTVIKNLSNGLDIYEEPIAVPGIVALGESMPSLVALGFRLVRSTLATRHGSKRIAGIPEGNVSGNTYGGSLVPLNTFAATLAEVIAVEGTADHDIAAEPVIVGRFPVGNPNSGELDLATINPVQAGQYIRVTSQVSRRIGRGS